MRRLLRRIWNGDPYANYELRVDCRTSEGYYLPIYHGSFQAMRYQVDYSNHMITMILDHPDVTVWLQKKS